MSTLKDHGNYFSFLGIFSLLSVFVFFFLMHFLSIQDVSARSASEESAYRAAEEVSRNFLNQIEKSENASRAISILSSCSQGVLKGKNSFGEYKARFLNASGSALSCSDRISRIVRLHITGYAGGVSFSLVSNVKSVDDNRYRCIGEFPEHAMAHSGDAGDLSANLAWQYASENTDRKCEYYCEADTVFRDGGCVWDSGSENRDPLDPATNVLLLSSHFDDELIWFEPWLHIVDTVMTPVMYPMTPYQEQQIGLKYLNSNSWIMPQGKLNDEALAEYRAHDRGYRRQYLTDGYITSLVENRVVSSDIIVTHSPWGEYGHEQHRQLFCVAQALAIKYEKDLYIWNGMPNEANKAGGMPAAYHSLRKRGGGELSSVSLEYHRNHYDAARNIFRQAELSYPQYHNGQACDPETNVLCKYWSWDRTWTGVYGTYNPPSIAKYYKMIDRGRPMYDKGQQESLLVMRPYFPDATVFGRRNCLVE